MPHPPQSGRIRFAELIPNPILRWSLYASLWIVLGLINFGGALIAARRYDPQIPAWEPFVWEMSSACVIGILVLFLVAITHRLEFRRGVWPWILLAHFALSVPFSLLHTSGMVSIRKAAYSLQGRTYDFGHGDMWREVSFEYYSDIQTYWTIVLVTLGVEYFNRYRERERLLADAQLQNLRQQLNPHFLFNALNMISSKMYEDVSQADAMIAKLSDLLRLTLRTSRQTEVPLQTDLEAIDLYLEIMKARFGDTVQIQVAVSPRAREALAPNLILQPIVENAFRHGGARVRIGAEVTDHTLILSVTDNGKGFTDSRETLLGRGFGLSNTAQRLEHMYGDRHRLDLRNAPGGGAEVVIHIPYRPA